jgi:hypothetical protein
MDVESGGRYDARHVADRGQLWQRRLVSDTLPGDPLMGLRSNLYRSARILGDMQAVTSGNPKRIERRAKNKLVGRALGRSGFWRFLWR